MQPDVGHGAIRAEIDPPVREQPKAIILHLRQPDRKPMRLVTVNGASVQDFDAKNEFVRLPQPRETVHVEAFYSG